jgi:hypothetical protein
VGSALERLGCDLSLSYSLSIGRNPMRLSVKFAVVTVILSLFGLPATASAAISSSHVEQVDFSWFVPCANEGAGEDVHFIGEKYYFSTVAFDETGDAHVTFHARMQGVTGVGLSSGDTYRVVGLSTVVINTTSAYTFEAQSMSRFVGPGPDNDFVVRDLFHFTLDPDGVLRAQALAYEVTCD